MPDPGVRGELVLVETKLPATTQEAREASAAISRALRRAAASARAPARVVSGGGKSHVSRADRVFRFGLAASFVALVAVPVAGATAYWGLIAQDQYAAEMKFAVRSRASTPMDALSGVLGGAMSQQGQNTQVVAEYIRSRALVEALESSVGLRAMYARAGDVLARLAPDASIEELEKYWRSRCDVSIETASGIVSVSIRAFDPQDAATIARRTLQLSESLVNEMSTRSRTETLKQAETELRRSEGRLQEAVLAMRDARNEEGTLDAAAEAQAINGVISALQIELARVDQDLAALGGRRDAPQARVLLARRNSLKSQIDKYKDEIATSRRQQAGGSLADRLGKLSRRQTDVDVARQIYAASAVAYEKARADLETQHSYVTAFIEPKPPQMPTYPLRLWEWLKIVAPSLLGWGALAGLAATIRDNRAK